MDNTIPFQRLTQDTELKQFDCGNSDLTDYFFHSAKKDIEKLLTVVYFHEEEGKTVLFFTLSNDKISEIENPDYKTKEISGDIPTFAMYFNLLSLIDE